MKKYEKKQIVKNPDILQIKKNLIFKFYSARVLEFPCLTGCPYIVRVSCNGSNTKLCAKLQGNYFEVASVDTVNGKIAIQKFFH